MSQLEVKDLKGKKVGAVDLGVIQAAEPRADLLHTAVVTEEANRRQGTQKTKTRAEVRGGGRKPYKQKKTGNARQGSIRSPHYAHGGMALALMPRDYTKGFNKKERRAAILGALKAQVEAGNVLIAESVSFELPKTKDALAQLTALGVADVRRVLVITRSVDEPTYRSFRNLSNVEVRTAPSTEDGVKTNTFSTRDILVAHKIVIAQDAWNQILAVWGGEEPAAPVKKSPAKKAAPPKADATEEGAEATTGADGPAKPRRTAKKKSEEAEG